MPAIKEIEMVEWLTTAMTSPHLGLWMIFGLITHASVDVFWSRGNEQEELCSRLSFKCWFTLLCSSCVEMLKLAYYLYRLCKKKWLQKSNKAKSEITQVGNMYITAQGVNSALQCSLVSFSCIGFHCIDSLFMLNLAKDEHCPPLKCLCHLEFWANFLTRMQWSNA